MIQAGPEESRPPRANVVADDAETLHAVMQSIEAGLLEFAKTIRDDAAPLPEPRLEPLVQTPLEAEREQVATAKLLRVADQLVEIESYRCVVGADDRPRTDADDR